MVATRSSCGVVNQVIYVWPKIWSSLHPWILDSQESEPEINVIELAKEQMTPKLPNPGDKLWETLDAQFEQSKCKDLDYNSLTVKELKIIAKERAIPKYGSMRKSELIAALQS